MNRQETDVLIIGAGPVGLMCSYLGQISGLRTVLVDKSDGPLAVGRADALNARSLQLLEIVDLFSALYPLGKTCNTSSIWANGKFLSRQSSWWDNLQGCLHKHFLMLGQSHVEKLLDKKLKTLGAGVKRNTNIKNIKLNNKGCLTILENGGQIQSKFVIGADGSHSFTRTHFEIPFTIIRPQMVWAVIDGIIDTDFVKVPEIIVFQSETSDVAWIPREGIIDRFYVRMDTKDFTLTEAVEKINHAMQPHSLRFKEVVWFSHFSVKESVAEQFFVHKRIFLAGDACHIHSVNGGQGLNTGLADAFNLMWKLNWVINYDAPFELLHSYEQERKAVALSVIETSGELVRSTKYAQNNAHAQDYVQIIEKRSGNITGMGIRYGTEGLTGTRLFDFELYFGKNKTRIYSLLDYTKCTLLIIGEYSIDLDLPEYVQLIQVNLQANQEHYWSNNTPYNHQAILVRPDAYIVSAVSLDQLDLQNFIKHIIGETLHA